MPEKWTGKLLGTMHNEDVTYDDLAKELGVTKSYVSMILNGRRSPPGIQKRMETALRNIVVSKKNARA